LPDPFAVAATTLLSTSKSFRQLNEYGQVLTEHVGSSELSAVARAAVTKKFHDRDLAWLQEAECLVAEVTTPSLGVGYEIARAIGWSKPVLASSGQVMSGALCHDRRQ